MGAASELGTGRSLPGPDVEAGSRRWAARLRPLLDLALVAWLIWLFDAVNNLAPVRQALAVEDGGRVLSLERSLHLAPEHTLNTWLSAQPTLRQIVVFWYENVHIGMTLAVLGWLWWKRRDLLGLMEVTLVLVNLIALAVFWSFPVAPPRMMPGGYVDLVASVHHLPTWRFGSVALHANQLCSLPSLHVAWATWCSIAIWQMTSRAWVRTLAVIYPLLTTLAVMSTANHYLADAASGAAITLVVFFALSRAPIHRFRREDSNLEGVPPPAPKF
jgi:PAP2 superfamily